MSNDDNGNGELSLEDRRWERFLIAYVSTGGVVRRAAKASGLHHSKHYRRLDSDPVYAERFAELTAQIEADREQIEIDRVRQLEDEAFRRAHDGWLEPVYYQGEVVGHTRKYSDKLLLELLRAYLPERFRGETTTVNVGAKVELHLPDNGRD